MPLVKSDVMSKNSPINIDDYMKDVAILIHDILSDYMSHKQLCNIIKHCLMTSGKMIRSKLLISISMFGDRKLNKNAIHQCSVVEITHLASLLHDDIIDDSLLRRDYPSAQSKYGKDVAVFAGDYMISRVFAHLVSKNLNKEALIISRTIADMCNGEVGQNLLKYSENVSEEKYFQNISKKTASFFKASCQMGAMNAGLDKKTTQDMMTFGQNLGLMFQIRDDLLDIMSTKKEIGKEVFKDFREGIYTYPVIVGLKDEKYKEKILSFIRLNKQRTLEKSELIQLKSYLLSAGADTKTISKINELSQINERILSRMPQESISTQGLRKILQKVGNI